MKRWISKMMAFVLLLAVASTMMPNTMQKVYADSGDPAMVKGTSVLAKNVNENGLQRIWFGRYDSPSTKKRMWYVIGYNGEGSNPASRKNLITILHKNIPIFDAGERFSGDSNVSNANQYAASSIVWVVNRYYNAWGDWKWNNSKEQKIIVGRTLEGGGSNYGQPGYDENKIKGQSFENAGFWLLSYGEAKALPGGIVHLYNDNCWWLRSPGEYDGKAAYCYTDYNMNWTYVSPGGVSTDTYQGVRPACDLDMNAILFTSAAEDGKASGSGADALTPVGTNKNSEWKLTIKDADRNNFDITTCEGSFDSESGAITFRYDGAKVESNSYISAIIVGSDDRIKYYGRIAEVSEETGLVTVNTSGKIENGDKLYVFNEQYNGNKTTDCASDMKEIALQTTVEHDWKEATCVNPATCKICGTRKGEALGHNYNEVVNDSAIEPTCTERGKEADMKCTNCGDVIAGAEIAALGHDWIVDDSTTADGWRASTTGTTIHEERTCNRCRLVEKREYELNHDHSSVPMSTNEGTPATCTTDGIKRHYECSCGYWFEIGSEGPVIDTPKDSDDFVIPALGHNWKAATCEQAKTCDRCGDTKGNPLTHDRLFIGWTWVGNEKDGYTEAIASYKCLREGCDSKKEMRITPTTRVIQPTCTEEGKTVYRVQISSTDAPDLTTRSNQKEAKLTDPTGHAYQEIENTTKTPTCTEQGKEADMKCANCGDVLEGMPIPALGHDWGAWTITKEATGTEQGEEARTCKRDPAHRETRAIDKLSGEANPSTGTGKLSKKANPLTVKGKKAAVKYSKLKKKNQTLAVTKVIKFTKKLKDKKIYKLISARKGRKSFKKYFRINKKTGKVTIKKGLKKGTYKIKIKVQAKGNSKYKASKVKKVTFTVKVK